MLTMNEITGFETITFSGRVLRRGFWLYAWSITSDRGNSYVYVGRTGDSSSPNAASPFNRMGQHLDFRKSAKGNAMMRNLRDRKVDPTRCDFEMTAVGPIFAEQETMDQHKPYRDSIAALECAFAKELKRRGYDVLGSHSSKKKLDFRLFERILAIIDQRFPTVANRDTRCEPEQG